MSKLLVPEGTKVTSSSLTKEKIEERLKVLEKEKLQLIGAIASYEGAIQDCQFWLKELTGGGQSNTS